MSPRRRTQPPAERSKLKNVALFASEEESSIPHTLPLDQITLPTTQPRRYFDPQAMQSLVESVKSEGILQPLLVRPVGEKYEVIAGERRYRAAIEAELTEVSVTVREMTDEQAVQYALIENLQREDLNPVEETEGLLNLLALRLGCDTAEVSSKLYRMENEAKGKITRNVSGKEETETIEQVFASVGRMNWQSFVRTRLPLLKLPADILGALRAGRLEYTKAKAIAQIKDETERHALLEDAIASSLSLSQIKERVKAAQPPAEPPPLASRIETISKLVKKHQVWDDPKKRKKLESLLAKIEELISPGGLDESQSEKEAEATHNEPELTSLGLQDSSPQESEKDFLESRKDVTEPLTAELSQPLEETASVLSERKTPSSEPLDESLPDAKEEPTHQGSEATDELLNRSLTHTQMVERLGVKSSTLGSAKKKPDFSEWSKSKDPDAIAWQWVTESKCFVPLKNQGG
jgi:ParB family chromosome partitioning protein